MPPQWTCPPIGASIKVRVLEAKKLVAADLTSSDPYVEIYCNDTKAKSSSKKNTLNPKWNESFTLKPSGIPQFVVISVRDHDNVGKDDPLGCAVIPTSDLIQGLEKLWWCPLQGAKRGLILISLTAENFGFPPGYFSGYNPITVSTGFYANRPHRGPIPRGYGLKIHGYDAYLYCKWEKKKKEMKKKAAKFAKIAGKALLDVSCSVASSGFEIDFG